MLFLHMYIFIFKLNTVDRCLTQNNVNLFSHNYTRQCEECNVIAGAYPFICSKITKKIQTDLSKIKMLQIGQGPDAFCLNVSDFLNYHLDPVISRD